MKTADPAPKYKKSILQHIPEGDVALVIFFGMAFAVGAVVALAWAAVEIWGSCPS